MQAGGPSYAVELGRFDGLTSTAASVNGKLPAPTFSLDQLNTLFASNGITQNDMVALSGMATVTVHMSFSSFICFKRCLESPSSDPPIRMHMVQTTSDTRTCSYGPLYYMQYNRAILLHEIPIYLR